MISVNQPQPLQEEMLSWCVQLLSNWKIVNIYACIWYLYIILLGCCLKVKHPHILDWQQDSSRVFNCLFSKVRRSAPFCSMTHLCSVDFYFLLELMTAEMLYPNPVIGCWLSSQVGTRLLCPPLYCCCAYPASIKWPLSSWIKAPPTFWEHSGHVQKWKSPIEWLSSSIYLCDNVESFSHKRDK